MEEASLVRKFIDADLYLSPEAFELLRGRPDSDEIVDKVLENIRQMGSKPLVITQELISKFLETEKPIVPPAIEVSTSQAGEQTKTLQELSHKRFKSKAAEFESRVKVLRDITGQSYSQGELKDFVNLFLDRYDKLSSIVRRRGDFQSSVPIGSLSNMQGETVRIVGMVADKRETQKGHVMIEVEDRSGRVAVWVFRGQQDLMQKAAEVVVDEVIGVEGSVRPGDRMPRLLARDIVWPDLPTPREPGRADEPVCAALISDLHIGSEMFLEDTFTKVIKWLRGEVGNPNQCELASKVKYLVIAGDLTDGIGIYPGQEDELLIRDIFKQYEVATELLAQIPDHIVMIIAPGNHDAVRLAEPQPAIPKDVAEGLYNMNSVMVGNPAWVSLHNVKFLVYHGRSFDDLIATVPRLNRENPAPSMIKLLQKRHLAPVYGGRTAIVPENKDFLVIDDIPDVLHCGHMHVYGHERYRDVIAVNSGTFQESTIFMRRMGVKPTPGIVPIIDLQTHQTRAIHFA